MTTYRLKDQELQRKLDEISNGDFSLKLQEKPESPLSPDFVEVGFSREKGKVVRCFTATFRFDDIEEVPEYDPNSWNRFPEVTPPEGVWMRVETDMGFGFKARFQFGDWLDNRNDIVGPPDGIDGAAVRFRPWEDPE